MITYSLQSKRTASPLAYFSEHQLHVVVAVLNVTLAAILLFGANLYLNYVTDEPERLETIAGNTVAFAICCKTVRSI